MPPQLKGAHQKFTDYVCSELASKSLKCLDDNKYDKEACQEAFEAYKDCKKREIEDRHLRRQEASATRNQQDRS